MQITSIYSRAQAIKDGVLVDLNQYIPLEESGVRFPVACTSAVFAIVNRAVDNREHMNDHEGIVWDILSMLRIGAEKVSGDTLYFQVIIVGAGRQRKYVFKAIVGLGDDHEPVVTIMLPDED